MKKNIAIVLVLAMVISLFAGCSASPASTTAEEGNLGFGPNNFIVNGEASGDTSSDTQLDPNRTSLSLSASGAKGPETIKTTTPITTSEFTKPSSLSTGKITHSGTGLEYYYYQPSTAAPAEGYPLLLWLHGTNGYDDPTSTLTHLWTHNADIVKDAVIIAPRWTGGLYQLSLGKYWETSDDATTLVKDIVSKSTYGKIDTNRIYIAGYSAGGMGTFREIAVDNHIYAAAAPFAGAATDTTMNDATLKTTPIWAWHGSEDTTVGYNSFTLGNPTKTIYNTIGSSSIMRFTTIDGAVHAGAPNSASLSRRLWSWLFQQKKGSVQTRDYTVEGYIRVVDANGNTVMTEIDCTGNPTYDSSTRTFTLTLNDTARTKLTNAYTSSNGSEFAVYYGNQKILTYTATEAVDSTMTKFVISGAFSSSYSDSNVLSRVTAGITANKKSKTQYSETVAGSDV